MKGPSSIRTLVLHAETTDRLSYHRDWRDAFMNASTLDASSIDIHTAAGRRRLRRDIRSFDLIVLLHSVFTGSLLPARRSVPILNRRRGHLVAFVGNEVNLPSPLMQDKIALLKAMEVDVVATQLLLEAGRYLYEGRTSARVISLPHALNPDAFKPLIPSDQRPIDIGVRSARYTAYLGDDDRNRLFDFFTSPSFKYPLTRDVATDERFDRAGWAHFLNRCRGTLATEAGSLYLEPDDQIVREIREYLRRNRGPATIRRDSPLFKIWRWVPPPIKDLVRGGEQRGVLTLEHRADNRLDFEEINQRFFATRPVAPVYTKAISSRHFDAVGTKTCQIMFPGRFNDILRADVHYLALARDFSNIDDVIARFSDAGERARITDEAYEYVMSAHTYTHRMAELVELVESLNRPGETGHRDASAPPENSGGA